jgi:membrane protease subunit HflK
MAWNEPGKGDKDPWGDRGNDGPPDLDDVVRNLQRKLGGIFGGGNSGDSNSSGDGTLGLGLIAVIIVAVWLASGIYTQDEAERGVVQRFGEYTRTSSPGLNWHLPIPIEKVEFVNVQESRTVNIGIASAESLMLTQDENIIEIKVEIQYRINDPVSFLFNVEDPSTTLKQMTESAVREVVGKRTMDEILKFGRAEMSASASELLQKLMDDYGTGLIVTSFNFPDIQAPTQVREAFADVIKAGADKERMKNQAEAYANDILPKARGTAFRTIQEAEAYKEQVISKAKGETSRFLQVMEEYEKAPEITRERLYIDAMESVYSRSQKILVDTSEGNNNVLYLPLDKLRSGSSSAPRSELNNLSTFPATDSTINLMGSSSQDNARSRGGR